MATLPRLIPLPALLRSQERLPHSPDSEPLPDLVIGRRLAGLSVRIMKCSPDYTPRDRQ